MATQPVGRFAKVEFKAWKPTIYVKETGKIEAQHTFVQMELPEEEYFLPGHGLCAGCTIGTIVRHMLKALGPNTIVINPTGCAEVSTVVYPRTNWAVPWLHVVFGSGGANAAGVETAIKVLQRKGVIDPNKRINIVVFAGDGATADIGFQSLSGMLERGHRVIYVMYDNEGYMNTGIQRSGTTPPGAATTTTPPGKVWPGNMRPKKPVAMIAAAHGIPYVATANPAHIQDMVMKFKKAAQVDGPSFIHILQSCTPGWRFEPKHAIRVLEYATETGYWINYEIENGVMRVTIPVKKRKHIGCFLALQGRFRHLTPEEVDYLQKMVDEQAAYINKIVGEEVIGPMDPSIPCGHPDADSVIAKWVKR